jgi:hypothetical protein
MARQHILLRAMVAKAKSFVNVEHIGDIVDIGMGQIHTDLTRSQLMDLAAIYKGVQPQDIQTASLPGEDFHGPGGAWDYRLYPDQMKSYVDWLVRGNEAAARQLTTVEIRNGTQVPGLAAHAASILRSQGYADVRIIGGSERPRVHMASQEDRPAVAVSQLLDTGVPDAASTSDLKSILGVPNAVDRRQPNKPNHLGWTAPPDVTIVLGQDYAQAVQANGGMSADATVSTATAPSTDNGTAPSTTQPSTDSTNGVPVTNEPAPSTGTNSP